MLVVSDHAFNTAGSRRIGERLRRRRRAARPRGRPAAPASAAAPRSSTTYGAATEARLPLVVGVDRPDHLPGAGRVLRAPLLARARRRPQPALGRRPRSGSITLVCKIPAGYPLGGHPYIDTVGAAAIFGVTFGLSIDYAVFLLARMRESYDVDGDNRAAIDFGLEKTAGVITGAAAIMAAVFVSFAAAPVATVSQMGVGPDGGDPARRDRGADRPAAGADAADRRPGLARPAAARPHPARAVTCLSPGRAHREPGPETAEMMHAR